MTRSTASDLAPAFLATFVARLGPRSVGFAEPLRRLGSRRPRGACRREAARRARALAIGVGLGLLASPSAACAQPARAPSQAREPSPLPPTRPMGEAYAVPRPGADEEALIASVGEAVWDPFQPLNRAFLMLNRCIDFVLLDPLSRAYGWAVPDPARHAIRRMFLNLNSPSILANDLLQLDLRDAGVTTLRFAINSTLGFGGLLDPMAENGWPGHRSDFGQTLRLVGIEPGPYFVIPLLGPTTARDGVGTLVDGFLRPQAWLLGPAERLLLTTTDGITLREESLQGIEALRESSVDYYTALRDAYLMNRAGELRREEARRAARPPLCESVRRQLGAAP